MNDLRFAFRQLAKSPGFTAIAAIALALGIGLNTTMFSLVNELVLRPLPYPEKDQLVRVYRTTAQDQAANHSAPSFLDLKREAADFMKLVAFRQWGYTLTQPGRSPESLSGLRVSADFFSVLGMQPELGRAFTPDEDDAGNHVVILSNAAWISLFGGDPAIVGQTVNLGGEATTVVGVMPAEFSSVFLWGPGDAFRPLGLNAKEKSDQSDTGLTLIGRHDKGITLEQLNVRLATVSTQLAPNRIRSQSEDGLRAATLQSTIVPQGTAIGTFFLQLLAGFVLLIVCGNLANLQLARAVARSREFAIRAALGASRARLLRPLLFEGLLLSLLGGVCGVLVAVWGNDWISKTMSANLPINLEIRVEWPVLLFAFFVSLITGVGFGLVPAWLSSRVRMNDALKTGSRGSTGDRSQHWLRNSLIVLQFSAALVLLSCTGFFIRGMETLFDREVGWKTTGVAHGILNLPEGRYSTADQTIDFYTRLDERLRSLPGVENVGIGWTAPMFMFFVERTYVVEGRPPPEPGREPVATIVGVTPTYLETLQARLVSGRQFDARDKAGSPPVVLINESFARSLFPDGDAVGHSLVSGSGETRVSAEIVGVFADLGMAGNPAPPKTPFQVLQPYSHEPWNYATVLVRSNQPGMTETLRRTVNEMDPNVPVQMLNTVEELAKIGTRGMTLITKIFGAFSTLGLFLAAIGLYGVIMHLVTQRTQEIGVRMALGAQLRDILSLIVGTGFRLALIGAGVGLLGSIMMNLIMGAVFNNGSMQLDYVTLGLTTSALVSVALIATYLPARRATKVNPMVALRAE
jgi:putative ABC transport system permease protein